MKQFWMVLSLLVSLIIAAGAGWYFFYNKKPQVAETPVVKERKALFYRHPMNPQVTSATPKKDEMGMDFIPVYEEEAEEVAGTVRISPEKIQKIGVKIEEVKKRTLKRTIRTDLMVHPGEKLLELYSPELVSTQEEYLLAIKAKERVKGSPSEEVKMSASSLVQAAKQRLKYWDIAGDQVKRLEEEGNVKRTMAILAPAHGIVTEKMINEGQKIEAGEMLFKIIDHSQVWVYGEVYEYELPFVKIGQTAKIIPSYTPAEIYTAAVNHIYTHFGTVRHEAEGMMEESRTAKIRFELPNPQHKLKLGMYVNVELAVDAAENALTVPDSAVIDTGARQVIFVEKGDGRFEPRDVKVGAQGDGYYHIISGVKEGEKVVTSANFLIDSESSFRAALQGMKHETQK